MDAFRVFDIVFATTGGGPGDTTNVLMFYAVKQGLQFFNVGFASAIANSMVLFIALFAAAFIFWCGARIGAPTNHEPAGLAARAHRAPCHAGGGAGVLPRTDPMADLDRL